MHRPHQPNPALQRTQTLALFQLTALAEWERTYKELLALVLVLPPITEPKPAKTPLQALIAEKTPAEETVLVWEFVIWRDVHIYDQKFFDDRNSWVKAPNLRTVVMTGVSVAAALATGGAAAGVLGVLGSAAITAGANIAVDAGFTAADVAGGYLKADEAWGAFAKRSTITAATSLLGATAFGASGFVSGGVTKLMSQNFASAMVNAGLQSATNKLVSSSINAFNWDRNGMSFNGSAFAKEWDPTNLANYSDIIGSMVSAGISTGLNDTGRGFLGEKWANYQKVGAFAGSLASTAVTYGLTGHASFNVLNIADFIPSTWKDSKGVENPNGFFGARAGLLELSFDQNGSSLGLGGGGMDISYNALQGVAAGLAVWKENAEINRLSSSSTANMKNLSAEMLAKGMRASASVEKENAAAYQQYLAWKEGKVSFADGKNQQAGGAESVLDPASGVKKILVGSTAGNQEFDFAIALAHEAMRDGLDNGEWQKVETRNAVQNHAQMADMIMNTYGADTMKAQYLKEAKIMDAYLNGKGTLDELMAIADEKYRSHGGDFLQRIQNGESLSYLSDGNNFIWEDYGTYKMKLFDGEQGESEIEMLARFRGLTPEKVQELLGAKNGVGGGRVTENELLKAYLEANGASDNNPYAAQEGLPGELPVGVRLNSLDSLERLSGWVHDFVNETSVKTTMSQEHQVSVAQNQLPFKIAGGLVLAAGLGFALWPVAVEAAPAWGTALTNSLVGPVATQAATTTAFQTILGVSLVSSGIGYTTSLTIDTLSDPDFNTNVAGTLLKPEHQQKAISMATWNFAAPIASATAISSLTFGAWSYFGGNLLLGTGMNIMQGKTESLLFKSEYGMKNELNDTTIGMVSEIIAGLAGKYAKYIVPFEKQMLKIDIFKLGKMFWKPTIYTPKKWAEPTMESLFGTATNKWGGNYAEDNWKWGF